MYRIILSSPKFDLRSKNYLYLLKFIFETCVPSCNRRGSQLPRRSLFWRGYLVVKEKQKRHTYKR